MSLEERVKNWKAQCLSCGRILKMMMAGPPPLGEPHTLQASLPPTQPVPSAQPICVFPPNAYGKSSEQTETEAPLLPDFGAMGSSLRAWPAFHPLSDQGKVRAGCGPGLPRDQQRGLEPSCLSQVSSSLS